MSELTTEYRFRSQLARRILDETMADEQSLAQSAIRIGVTRNMLHRMIHFDDPVYDCVNSLDAHFAVMDWLGISMGDFERKTPTTMSELLSMVDALPGLEEHDRHVLRTTLMSLYCSLREGVR